MLPNLFCIHLNLKLDSGINFYSYWISTLFYSRFPIICYYAFRQHVASNNFFFSNVGLSQECEILRFVQWESMFQGHSFHRSVFFFLGIHVIAPPLYASYDQGGEGLVWILSALLHCHRLTLLMSQLCLHGWTGGTRCLRS